MKYFILHLAIALALCACSARGQTFSVLVQFTGTGGTASGRLPYGSLIASGGTLYGMTQIGGANGYGNIFSVGVNGANYQNVLSFTGSGGAASGAYPQGSLIASGGRFYGMTFASGANGYGTVFSVGTDGTNCQNLVSFTGTGGTASGAYSVGSLLAVGGTLYGVANEGGADGYGTIFSVGTGGTNFQSLVSFTGSGSGGTASGEYCHGSLIASGGTLFGMSLWGGSRGFGNIFSVGTDGTNYRNLVSFIGGGGSANGIWPQGSLIVRGGTLYGMTYAGGANGDGTIFSVGMDGTNYQNVVSFTGTGGAARGENPYGSLLLSGTRFYGMTGIGGVHDDGDIFSVGIDGSGYQDLYDFTGGTDGAQPYGDLLASGGTLFGMASHGGANGDGTVFALTLPALTPEPGTLALAGSGAASLAWYHWRRRRRRRR